MTSNAYKKTVINLERRNEQMERPLNIRLNSAHLGHTVANYSLQLNAKCKIAVPAKEQSRYSRSSY